MNIQVEYKDTNGKVSSRSYQMTRIAFAKHMAIAGQGYAPNPQKLFRTLGMFLHYSSYIQRDNFYNDRFSEPPIQMSDPTEKGQFSNLAGKAIADFLSKKINKSLYTVNYESAMRVQGFPITGQRPDLIAYSPTSMFAIEAKGRSQNNPGNMYVHKSQAQSGPINVNFSVACVSYNLFNQVACMYYDPLNDNVEYDNVSLQSLSRIYYKGLSEFLNKNIFEYQEVKYYGESFFEVDLLQYRFHKESFSHSPFYELFKFYRPQLILPAKIDQYSRQGITNEIEPFLFDTVEKNNNGHRLYIDNDRVGLRVRK